MFAISLKKDLNPKVEYRYTNSPHLNNMSKGFNGSFF